MEELRGKKEEDQKRKEMKTCDCGLAHPKGKQKCDCGRLLPSFSVMRQSLLTEADAFLKNETLEGKKNKEMSRGPLFTMYYMENGKESLSSKTSLWNTFSPPSLNDDATPVDHATPHLFLGPLDVNPGCKEGLCKVLESLVNEAGPDREIIPVVLDGSPFHLAHKLIRLEPASFHHILLIPGVGHEELNMYRLFFELIWSIMGKEFSISHGYQTE